jgi:hypothetical protein
VHQYTTETTVDVALSAGVAKTVLQIAAPATRRGKVKEVGISFDGTNSAADPVEVVLMRQSTAGTMTSQTPTPRQDGDPAALFSGSRNASAEPTPGNVIGRWLVSPAGGLFVIQYPQGDEPEIAASGRVGLVCNSPAAVNCQAYIVHQE